MSLNEFGALYKSDAVVRNVCGDYEIAPGAWLTHRRWSLTAGLLKEDLETTIIIGMHEGMPK